MPLNSTWPPALPRDESDKGASGIQGTNSLAEPQAWVSGLSDQGGGAGHCLLKM